MPQLTPNLVASGNVRPNRFIKISGTNTGSECVSAAEKCVGVTDGSVKDPSSAYNATSGTPLFLQQPNEVWVYCGATAGISAGVGLSSDGNGAAVVYANAATTVPIAIALETPSAAGVLMRCWLLSQTAPGA